MNRFSNTMYSLRCLRGTLFAELLPVDFYISHRYKYFMKSYVNIDLFRSNDKLILFNEEDGYGGFSYPQRKQRS